MTKNTDIQHLNIFRNSFRINYVFNRQPDEKEQIVYGTDSDDAIEYLEEWFKNENKRIRILKCEKVSDPFC